MSGNQWLRHKAQQVNAAFNARTRLLLEAQPKLRHHLLRDKARDHNIVFSPIVSAGMFKPVVLNLDSKNHMRILNILCALLRNDIQ